MDFLKGFNWVVVLGIVVAVETQIGNGSMSLANMVPESWIPYVKAWAANLGSVGALIMSAGSFGSRPQGQFTITPPVKSAVILALVLGAMFALVPDAHAQVMGLATGRRPAITGDVVKDVKTAIDQQKAATGTAASDPKAALPCMDISVITKITAENLVPTMKGCAQDVNTKLVTDTQRALDSAKAFTGNASTAGGAAVGDNDAVNCLTPALALFKAAAIIPATPDVPAVLNPDGSIKTPAVAGTPEIDPGPILLYQKYREFTLAGALTSCQAWFNGPINATAAAGVGGAATVLGGAALLSPLK